MFRCCVAAGGLGRALRPLSPAPRGRAAAGESGPGPQAGPASTAASSRCGLAGAAVPGAPGGRRAAGLPAPGFLPRAGRGGPSRGAPVCAGGAAARSPLPRPGGAGRGRAPGFLGAAAPPGLRAPVSQAKDARPALPAASALPGYGVIFPEPLSARDRGAARPSVHRKEGALGPAASPGRGGWRRKPVFGGVEQSRAEPGAGAAPGAGGKTSGDWETTSETELFGTLGRWRLRTAGGEAAAAPGLCLSVAGGCGRCSLLNSPAAALSPAARRLLVAPVHRELPALPVPAVPPGHRRITAKPCPSASGQRAPAPAWLCHVLPPGSQALPGCGAGAAATAALRDSELTDAPGTHSCLQRLVVAAGNKPVAA